MTPNEARILYETMVHKDGASAFQHAIGLNNWQQIRDDICANCKKTRGDHFDGKCSFYKSSKKFKYYDDFILICMEAIKWTPMKQDSSTTTP
jgi:hypothetical protein